MLRKIATFLILLMVLASGCSKRKPDHFIDTVHGYLRCNAGLRNVDAQMLAMCPDYGFKTLRSEYEGIGHEENHRVLYGYLTVSYLLPGDTTLTIKTVAEKGQPLHARFKLEPGGLYTREEIMIELARRIKVLPKAKPLKAKTPLEDSDITPEINL
jgi:hypothetical protein